MKIITKKSLTFLCSVKECPVRGGIPHIEQLGSGQELHDEARGDNGGDAQLHEGSPVGSQDDSDPVEGISRVGGHDAKEWDLAAHQEDEEGDGGPQDLLPKLDLALGLLDLGQHRAERLHKLQELDCKKNVILSFCGLLMGF